MAEAPTPQGLLNNNQSFGTIAPYEPNMVEKAQGLLAQGLMKFGYDPRDAYVQANKIINTQGNVGAADFTPIVSDLIGAQDAYDMGVDAKKAFNRDEYLKALGYGAGSAVTGILSGLGLFGTVVPPVDKAIDAARAGVKKVTGLLDSGNLITGAERDANFKNWFGDSKVVDGDGKPLTVYHGGVSDISEFKKTKLGGTTGSNSAKEGFWFTDDPTTAKSYADYSATDARVLKLIDDANIAEKKGDWDLYDKKIGEAEALEATFMNPQNRMSGQNIMPVHLALKNPYEIDAGGEMYMAIEDSITNQIKRAKKLGHDGVVIKNLDDAAGIANRPANHYLVFEPEKIKSIHNRGTYDSNDANILKGIAPIAGAGLLGAGMMRQEDQQPQQGILN